MLWKLCDILEGAWHELVKCPVKRLKAGVVVWLGMVFGSTRAKMVKDVSKLGYKESYAEKFVDKMIKKYRGSLEGGGVFRIRVEPEPVKGQFGKPYSRRRKPGRPSAKYKLEELSKVKLNKRMEELVIITMLLSGSFIRFIKLLIRMLREEPKIREALVEAVGKALPVPLNELEESLNKALADSKGKPIEEAIDNWYSEIMKPVYKEIPGILGLKLPVEGKPQDMHDSSLQISPS